MMETTILIADDNFVARRGLRSVLDLEGGIAVKGEASTPARRLSSACGKPRSTWC